MGDCQVIDSTLQHTLYKAERHGVRFKLKTAGCSPRIVLIAKHKPAKHLYKIILGPDTKVMNLCDETEAKYPSKCLASFNDFKELWITWYNNKIKVGMIGLQKAFLEYDRIYTEPEIGLVHFKTTCRQGIPVEWIVESSPVSLKSLPSKRFSQRLYWVPMNMSMTNSQLPPHAMIGGFENELTYIARSHHNNALCPGKYVPSTGLAFVPWGHREHSKQVFEILCGFNAKWIKTRCNNIPPNAYIAGHSEVLNEPLFIGRAMYDGKLLTGKVHVRYELCYLPYKGREVAISTYEILVLPESDIKQAITSATIL